MIADYGLIVALEKAKTTLADPAVFVTTSNHATHWIVAGFYRGFEKPEDNGYYFASYPKAKYSLEHVQSVIHNHLNNTFIQIEKDPQQSAPGYGRSASDPEP